MKIDSYGDMDFETFIDTNIDPYANTVGDLGISGASLRKLELCNIGQLSLI